MRASRTYWFGRKRIGWGFGPRTWQGWVVTSIYCILMVAVSLALASGNHALYVTSMISLSAGFLWVFFWKLDTSK